jgi:uncharacterized membrane protein YdjX (TVP38/TMEM64 family)
MRKLLAFLNNMDARGWRTVAITVVLLALVCGMIVLGKSGLLASPEQMESWLEGLRASPWALPATIVVFIVTSFLAAPQFLLAAACMVAFGPVWGFIYGLVGTLVSSWLHFYMGRWGGAPLVERYGGSQVNRLSRFIGRNDFVASAIVRNVPTAPAIVVNMAFGASKADLWRFIAGVAVGSIPKILIVALFGQSVLSAMGGGVALAVGAAIAVAGISITVALAARKVVRGEQPDGDEPPAATETPSAAAPNAANTAPGG